jgi:transcriptional regulator with XRE-family HTH domain
VKKKDTADFDEFLAEQLSDPAFADVFEEEKPKVDLAIKLAKLRTEAGLSQKELARRVGTTQSGIARMESPQYAGHSVRMLRRVAFALGRRLRIEFEPAKTTAKSQRRRREVVAKTRDA